MEQKDNGAESTETAEDQCQKELEEKKKEVIELKVVHTSNWSHRSL
jgi:molecular chaperone GrpE